MSIRRGLGLGRVTPGALPQRQAALITLAVYGSLVADELDQMERAAGLGAYIQATVIPVAFDDLPRLYADAA